MADKIKELFNKVLNGGIAFPPNKKRSLYQLGQE